MDDRTMLELAAKAAGLYAADDISDCWTDTNTGEEGEPLYPPCGFVTLSGVWNPLLDDGDALRLASELHINIEFVKGLTTKQFVEISAYPSGRGDCLCLEPIGDDPNKATRRAIARAAAEIQLVKESGK